MHRTLLPLACWVGLGAPALAQTTPATRALVSCRHGGGGSGPGRDRGC